jgi:peptidoglycan/LPS O-acetylase OafA/YrhL
MRIEAPPSWLDYLDGLRRLAALSVALAHFFAALVPALQFGSDFSSQQNWQTAFAASLGFSLINGPFSVYIFMVLSGFVISSSAERSMAPLSNLVLARFLRLHIPAAFAVGFTVIQRKKLRLLAISFLAGFILILVSPDRAMLYLAFMSG